MMRSFAFATALVGTVVSAAPALAAVGQCYDAYGRPVGHAYDTNYPNYTFMQSVMRSGGACVAVNPGAGQNAYPPAQRHYYNDPTGSGHSNWCGSNPPSGYCIVPEKR